MIKLHERLRERLPMWVVYRPIAREFAGLWIAHMHVTLPEPRPTRFIYLAPSLVALRTMLPPGLVQMTRDRHDAPEIEELWV